jgi:hypothetical protein
MSVLFFQGMAQSAPSVSRYSSAELLMVAGRIQYLARHREAAPSDCFLVSPTDELSLSHPALIQPLTVQESFRALAALRSTATCSGKGRRSQVLIRKTFDPQAPDSVVHTDTPIDSCASLPGGVPLIDHLCLRAREESGWMALAPALEEIRERRSPKGIDHDVIEIHLGETSADEITKTTRELAIEIQNATDRFGFCLLAGDAEYVRVPKSAMTQFWITNISVQIELASPWEKQEDTVLLPVKFMMGTDKFSVFIRPPISYESTEEGQFITLHHIKLPAEFYDLVAMAGPLVGVGIHHDVKEFENLIFAATGQQIRFPKPVDLAVIARIAGYNLPRHSLAALAWTALGVHLAKGVASVGDGLWFKPMSRLEEEYMIYAVGDVAQSFLTSVTIITSWVFHIFPDFHAVSKASYARNVRDLLHWWSRYVIVTILDDVRGCPAWTPVANRAEAINIVVTDEVYGPLFRGLTPDWPHITSGGCRFFHSARAWLFPRLPALAAMDKHFWPANYREIEPLLRLGRDVLAEPSPRDPAVRFRLMENPEFKDLLPTPAEAVTPAVVDSLIKAGRPRRAILLEYAIAHPHHAADLLIRMETSKSYAMKICKGMKKVYAHVNELRRSLTALCAMPRRPEGWEDPLPVTDVNLRDERVRAAAIAAAEVALRKSNAYLSRHQTLTELLEEQSDEPAKAAAITERLSRAVNVRAPGKPEDDHRVFMSMGSRTPIRRPRSGSAPPASSRARARRPRPRSAPAASSRSPTSRLPSPAPSASSGTDSEVYLLADPNNLDSLCRIRLSDPSLPEGLFFKVQFPTQEKSPSPARRAASPASSGSIPCSQVSGPLVPWGRSREVEPPPRQRSASPPQRAVSPVDRYPYRRQYVISSLAEQRIVRYRSPKPVVRRSSSEWSDTPAQKRRRSRSRRIAGTSSESWASPTRHQRSRSPLRRTIQVHHAAVVPGQRSPTRSPASKGRSSLAPRCQESSTRSPASKGRSNPTSSRQRSSARSPASKGRSNRSRRQRSSTRQTRSPASAGRSNRNRRYQRSPPRSVRSPGPSSRSLSGRHRSSPCGRRSPAPWHSTPRDRRRSPSSRQRPSPVTRQPLLSRHDSTLASRLRRSPSTPVRRSPSTPARRVRLRSPDQPRPRSSRQRSPVPSSRHSPAAHQSSPPRPASDAPTRSKRGTSSSSSSSASSVASISDRMSRKEMLRIANLLLKKCGKSKKKSK